MSSVVGMKRTPEHNAKIGATAKAKGLGSSPTKSCPSCKLVKPRTEFGRRTNGYSKSYCRACEAVAAADGRTGMPPERRESLRQLNRKAKLKRYGITPDEYVEMSEAQGGVCAICGNEQMPGRKHLDVDHWHDSGHVRSLLCNHCNRGLGVFSDDPERLRAAADYIEFHERVRNGEVDRADWLDAITPSKQAAAFTPADMAQLVRRREGTR